MRDLSIHVRIYCFTYFIHKGSIDTILTGTLPLVLNTDVSPPGNHSVKIVVNNAKVTVSYMINGDFVNEPAGKYIFLKQNLYIKTCAEDVNIYFHSAYFINSSRARLMLHTMYFYQFPLRSLHWMCI